MQLSPLYKSVLSSSAKIWCPLNVQSLYLLSSALAVTILSVFVTESHHIFFFCDWLISSSMMSSSLSLLEHVPELSFLLGLNNTLLLYPLGAYIKQNVIYRRKEFKPLPCMCSLMYLCDSSSPLWYLLRCAIAGFSNSLIRLKILICIVYVYGVESVYPSTFPRSSSRLCVKCIYFLSSQWPWILHATGCFGIMILFDILNVLVFCLHVFLCMYVQCLHMARRGRQNPLQMWIQNLNPNLLLESTH